jgi:hypothetical protein
VDGLNIVRVIVSPSSAHAFGMDMIGYDVGVLGEFLLTKGANALLCHDLPVKQFPHFAIRAEFPVPPGMMRILNAPNTHLVLASFSRDCLSSAAEM